MKHSDALDKLAPALVAAQADMTNPPLDGVNPHFRSKFTTLASLCDHTRPVLAKHGLALVQHPVGDGGNVGVETILMHTSGQWLSEEYRMPLPKDDPQTTGSVVTYLRRYAHAAMANVQGDEDTDAEPMRAPQTSPSAPSRRSEAPQVPAQGSDVREASEKQRKMLFAVTKKAKMMNVVDPVVHEIKLRNGGTIPMAWMGERLDEVSKNDFSYFIKAEKAIRESEYAAQKKGESKEPDGEDLAAQIAAEFDAEIIEDDESDIPF